MKIKLLILGLGLGASILAGCNDDFSSIGTSIQPGDDTIAVYMDTFQICLLYTSPKPLRCN